MQLEVKIDSSYEELKVLILTASINDEVQEIIDILSYDQSQIITGHINDKIEILEPNDIINIYAHNGKVFAVTQNNEYTMRYRLYEIEEKLNTRQFIRISNSEIINLKMVKNFDLSMTGTICVKLKNNTTTYVSRRYVSKIKKKLGI